MHVYRCQLLDTRLADISCVAALSVAQRIDKANHIETTSI